MVQAAVGKGHYNPATLWKYTGLCCEMVFLFLVQFCGNIME